MRCPECGAVQHCPCDACKKRKPGKVTWVWKGPNGPIACGMCGHTMSAGEWMDLEWEQFKKTKGREDAQK